MKNNQLTKLSIILLLHLFFIGNMYAQKMTIQGIVVERNESPVIGATVMEKGTTTGTITDFNGKFTMEVNKDAVIRISYLGFKSLEIKATDVGEQAIVLEEDNEVLEEVVVVGYGVQKKASITGAISSTRSEDLLMSSSPTLGAALAGKITGLTSIQGSGQPGADDAAMYLRGVATSNGTSPLIMVDGVPRDELRVIDPNEIESVSVLKDASATAVFGVRGANGVILITTKRGSTDKTSMNVSVVQSFSSFTRRPEHISSLEYMELRNQATRNDDPLAELPYGPEVFEKFKNPLAGLDPNDPDYAKQAAIRKHIYPNHDYYRESVRSSAPQTRINMNVNGGTDKVKYFINGNYLYQGSSFKHESKDQLGYDPSYRINRFGLRSNLDFQFSKSIKAFMNVGGYIEKMGMPSQPEYITSWQDMVKHTIWVLTAFPALTPGPTTIDGFGVPAGETVNPTTLGVSGFELLGRMGYRETTNSTLNSTLGLDWDLNAIVQGLSHKAMFSFDYYGRSIMQGEQYLPMYDARPDYENNTISYTNRRPNTIYLTTTKRGQTQYKFNLQYSINYSNTFDDVHSVGAMALFQRDSWESWNNDSWIESRNWESALPYAMLGVVGRLTYGYDNRYLFEVNMGYNGSEQFKKGNRFGFFPAVSGAWIVSNEKFLRDNNTITNLKLRASYGKVGNDQISGARFLYLNDIELSEGGIIGSLAQGNQIVENLYANENLTWEIAKKQNYGIDLQLFKDLSVSFDYFKENRSNILITRNMVPSLQGIPIENLPKANLGEVENKGYEVEVSYNKKITKDLSIMLKGNFSYAKNKVINMDEPLLGEDYAHRYRATGYSLNQQWGIPIDYSNGNGYFNSQEELDDYLENYATYGIGDPKVGYFKYIDVNEDGVIDNKDNVPIGYSPVPRINYGITLGAKFKGFDFNVFFQGIAQSSNYYSHSYVFETSFEGSYFDYHRNAWTAERYAAGEKIEYPALGKNANTNHIANSFFIMDRSYCRLRNAEIGYTLPVKKLLGLGFNNLRLSVSGQNLFTITNFRMKYVDPELTHQMDYPLSKTVSFAVNVNF